MRKILLLSSLLAILCGCGASKDTSVMTGPDGTKVTVGKDNMKIDGPDGSGSFGGTTSVTEAELGVPFYPGSTPKPNSDVKFEGKGEKNYMSVRLTDDTPQQVMDFYKDKVPGTSAGGTASVMAISGKLESGAKFSATAMKNKDGKTEVNIGIGIKS